MRRMKRKMSIRRKWALWHNSKLWLLHGVSANLSVLKLDLPKDGRVNLSLAVDFVNNAIKELEELNTYDKFQEVIKGE